MLMRKGLDLKILYTILIAVSGIVLTIGAASALMIYSENIVLDNGSGDSSITVKSSTGHAKVILDDEGTQAWSIKTNDNKKKFQITDENRNKPRFTIEKNGLVGIGVTAPQYKLDVNGPIHTNNDAIIDGNLDVGGAITGSYIATLEATIADLEARLAALEASMAINEPMIVTNEAMIATHDTTLASHDAMILSNQADIATNAEAIESGGGGPNPCNPDGDGAIIAQEVKDLFDSNGFPMSLNDAQGIIDSVEGPVGDNNNDVLDTPGEVAWFNGNFVIPAGVTACVFP